MRKPRKRSNYVYEFIFKLYAIKYKVRHMHFGHNLQSLWKIFAVYEKFASTCFIRTISMPPDSDDSQF